MFGRIGMGELLLILGIVLLVFGPSKLPALARSMGEAVAQFRKGTEEFSKELELAKPEEKSGDKEAKN